ncbi:hypothetical protein PV11_08686 [Exophiala sideris]|uniref:CBM1 domain-containing protein n=1 Tax=Exophiala sideris TaxID=1016849 RepID=A0A0D1WNZ7_9EURO|nr:hypothetical protein PV11_08686 [Exophiala sideris]
MQTWKITLTAAATLLQLTQASPTPLISGLACTDGEVYNGFTISCATDLAGGDMGVTQTSTLDGCIDTCASTTGCVAISYVAPFCYLKNVAEGTSSSANVIAAMVDSTGPCSSGSTASSYTTGDDTFSVTCGWDYSGYDISNEQTTTFEGCMDACVANSQCYAVSYTTGSWCYMKSAGVGGSANSNVNVASLPSSSTTTTTTTPSTTTASTTATTSTTTTAAASGLCLNEQGDGSSFTSGSKTYTISCGFDYNGYDISLVQTSTFEGCLSACSSNSDCTALSWTTAGFCYMKNGVSAGDENALVMGAYVPSASSTTTTTTSTTTTSTTSSTTTTTPSTSLSTTTSTTSSTTPITSTSTTTTTPSTTVPTTTTTSITSTTTSAPTTTSTTTSTTSTTTTTMPTTTTTATTESTSSTTSSTTNAATTSSTTTVAPTTTTTTTVPTTTATSTSSSTTTSSSTSTTTSPTTTSTTTTTATTSPATTSTFTPSTTTTTSQISTTTSTSSAACATNYGQCGGSNWNGATCCQGGWTCQYQNDFYYQCVAPSSTSVTTTTTTTKISSSSTTTTPPSRTTTTTVPTTTTTLKTSTTTARATTTSTTTTTTTTTKTTTTKVTTTTASPKSTCATAYAQCGGWFWNGATCCPSGYRCQEQNILYWQCV